jgi:hypothetical protein
MDWFRFTSLHLHFVNGPGLENGVWIDCGFLRKSHGNVSLRFVPFRFIYIS